MVVAHTASMTPGSEGFSTMKIANIYRRGVFVVGTIDLMLLLFPGSQQAYVDRAAPNLDYVVVGSGVSGGTGNQLWVTDATSLEVFTHTGLLTSIPIPGGPQYITIPPGFTAYVTTRQGSVYAVDLATHKLSPPLFSGGSFGPMDYNAFTSEVYIPDMQNKLVDVLSPIDSGTSKLPHEPAYTIRLGVAPQSIAITSDGALGFIALAGGHVAMLDIQGKQIVNTIFVGGNPQFMFTGLSPPLICTTPQQASIWGTVINVAAYVLVVALLIVPIVLFGRYARAGNKKKDMPVSALTGGMASAPTSHVDVMNLNPQINPASLRFLTNAISTAETDGAQALVIEINTPGGDIPSMEAMKVAELNSTVPIISYVSPPTAAYAVSAGAFITLAAHIAAMAPGTTIGASSPVTSTGGDIGSTGMKKIESVLVSDMTNIQTRYNRNVTDATKMVTDAASYTDQQAKDKGIIDLKASSLGDLLNQVNGRSVTLASGSTVTLQTAEIGRASCRERV